MKKGNTEKKKVIIIGAGPAGLTCAYQLLKYPHYEVVVVEEDKQCGGISKTVQYNGNRMDIGGHRFFSKNDEVMNFWKELMPLQNKNSIDDEILKVEKELPKEGANPQKEENVMLIRNRI